MKLMYIITTVWNEVWANKLKLGGVPESDWNPLTYP